MRIFLVGFMGAGKTTVGRLLAHAMDLRFVDLDERIETDAGMTVPGIFEREGEAGFRERERRALREVAVEEGVVVATGGGAMVAAANRELMAAGGTTVWLNPRFETLARRIAGQPETGRPLFADPESARGLFDSRVAFYEKAELRVDVGAEEAAASVATRVADLLREERCGT